MNPMNLKSFVFTLHLNDLDYLQANIKACSSSDFQIIRLFLPFHVLSFAENIIQVYITISKLHVRN